MVDDTLIMKAVPRILQRSERQEDIQKLVGTFVDVGVLPQLNNQNNQILYGRRGTGKTHVLKVLSSQLQENAKNIVVYIDARTLGSTAQYSDDTLPMRQRCLALFRDILLEIHTPLVKHIFDNPPQESDTALQAVSDLASAIVEPVKTYIEDTVSETLEAATSDKSKLSVSAGTDRKLSLSAEAGSERSNKDQVITAYKVTTDDKVVFPNLNRHLSIALEASDSYLYILLDEWSQIPLDIQPYLAEFLKRGILPIQRATIKIGSLEYRSRFAILESRPIIGFELGADIATAPDLDEYFVFDRNPDQIANTYADVLLRHLDSELPEGYLKAHYDIETGNDLISRMFTEKETFKELARASEGVVRDLINIFTTAFFDAQRRGRKSIDKSAILDAARKWFEQDKSQYLDDQLQSVLRKIVDNVIGGRKARAFLLPRALEKHPVVQKLFDARVLHHLQRGYADKDNPGLRYNIYTLDYGTYVDLMGTSKQPTLDFLEADSEIDLIVPFNDKRSIRRIILSEEVLE